MAGVTILNEFEVLISGYDLIHRVNVIFIFGLFLVGLICCGTALAKSIKEKNIPAIIISFIFSIFFLVSMFPVLFSKPKYETRYEVSVTEETSMNDFFDKYELIEKRGLIYTVKEKDNIE